MKTKRKALAVKNRPRGLGGMFFVVTWLVMDRLQPPGWVWGVVGTICAFLLLVYVIDFFTAEDVELP